MSLVTDIAGGLAVVFTSGAFGSAVTKLYDRRRKSADKHDDILVRMLERLQAAHDQALERERAATEAATVPRVELGKVTERLEALEARNDDCEARNVKLAERVRRLERGETPVHGTPMVERTPTDRTMLPPPVMHESVGGYRERG